VERRRGRFSPGQRARLPARAAPEGGPAPPPQGGGVPRLRKGGAVPRAPRRTRPNARLDRTARGRRQAALHREGRPARDLPVRPVRKPHERRRPPARLVGHDRQAHRGRLHARGRRGLVRGDGPHLRGLRAAPGRRPAERLRLRAVHGRPRRALRSGNPRGHRDPDLRRQHRPADHGDARLRRDGAVRCARRRATSCTSSSGQASSAWT